MMNWYWLLEHIKKAAELQKKEREKIKKEAIEDEDNGDANDEVWTEFDDNTEPYPLYVTCSCGLHEIDIRKDPYEEHRRFEDEMGV